MALLKKIRAATLVETMVASVIIVVVFLVASLSLNNIFKTAISSNDSNLQNRISEVTYFVINEKLTIPFYEENDQWDIAVEKINNEVIVTVFNKKNSEEKQLTINP